jgi:hypothetical protein
MKKALWTLAVDGYSTEITDRTFPLLKYHAHKIGAEFHVITERKFPNFPAECEKLQIYELGRGYDWNLFFDADAIVNPDLFDITEHIQKDTVMHYAADFAGNRWAYDRFFRRDGRNIGDCGWFTLASDWCHEVWEPLTDMTCTEAESQIFPVRCESTFGMGALHCVDGYIVGRNIAKYGLKFKTFLNLLKELDREKDIYFWHQCLISREEKIQEMDKVLRVWGLPQGGSRGQCGQERVCTLPVVESALPRITSAHRPHTARDLASQRADTGAPGVDLACAGAS